MKVPQIASYKNIRLLLLRYVVEYGPTEDDDSESSVGPYSTDELSDTPASPSTWPCTLFDVAKCAAAVADLSAFSDSLLPATIFVC